MDAASRKSPASRGPRPGLPHPVSPMSPRTDLHPRALGVHERLELVARLEEVGPAVSSSSAACHSSESWSFFIAAIAASRSAGLMSGGATMPRQFVISTSMPWSLSVLTCLPATVDRLRRWRPRARASCPPRPGRPTRRSPEMPASTRAGQDRSAAPRRRRSRRRTWAWRGSTPAAFATARAGSGRCRRPSRRRTRSSPGWPSCRRAGPRSVLYFESARTKIASGSVVSVGDRRRLARGRPATCSSRSRPSSPGP